MKANIPIAACLLVLSACSSDKAGQHLYTSGEIGEAVSIVPCTVVSARPVMIRERGAGDKGEAIGFIAGALASAENNNSPLVRYIGALVGGAAGRAASDSLHERAGVEYTVLLGNGEERQLIQDTQANETLLQTGEPCRMQVSGAFHRVLPAAHYPESVKRPQKTQVID